MTNIENIIKRLNTLACEDRAKITRTFFKTDTGSYSEHDKFIGIRVPILRNLAKEYQSLSIEEVKELLSDFVRTKLQFCRIFASNDHTLDIVH